MEAKHAVSGETKPAKVSFKSKLFCYVGINFGYTIFLAVHVLEGRSPTTALFEWIGNLVFWNSLFWFLFRARDRGIDALQGK